MAFGRLNESRGGAPRGERIPLDAQPRPKRERVATFVCVARFMAGAPVGAPPPCFVWGNRIKQSSGAKRVARTVSYSLPPRSGGEGRRNRASDEPGWGEVRSPPPLIPPHHARRARGEGKALHGNIRFRLGRGEVRNVCDDDYALCPQGETERGNSASAPTLDPSPPRASRAGGGKARTLTRRENG